MPAHSLKIHAPALLRPFPVVDPGVRAEPRRRDRLEVGHRLLARCRAGDPAAFEALFEKTKDHVYTLALSFSGDEATAADVTQEVFLKLLERIR